MASVSDDLDRIADARAAYAVSESRIRAGEPWDLAADFGTGPEADWGPREVLAHVAEMLPFWLGELERVAEGKPGPTAFGRVADDPVRIGRVERERTLPLRVLFGRIDRGLRDWADRIAALTDDERAAIGLHPRLGELPAATILDRFVLGHAEEHIAQLEAILVAGTD